MAISWQKIAQVEDLTIARVPKHERAGKPRDLLSIWFSVNIMPLTVVTGVVGPTVDHLSLGWSILAILLGNAVGAIFMALHSAQGPDLGIPQMIQTRAQFGSYGALLIVFVVILIGIGYAASILVVGGESVNQLSHSISINAAIVIVGVAAAFVLLFGYNLFHRFNRMIIWIMVAGVGLAFLWALVIKGLPATRAPDLGITFAGFLGMVSLAVVWQISYAPYVSDYSRYMAPQHSNAKTFWMTYGGTVVGGSILMVFGALVGWVSASSDTIGVVHAITGGIAPLIMIVFLLGAIDAVVINIYTPMLCSITIGQTFKPSWLPRATPRVFISVSLLVLSIVIALFLRANFLADYSVFLGAMLYLLIPWTAINLVDFYLLRHGDYDIDSILRADGGQYGKFDRIGLACYAIGVAVQIPFMYIFPFAGWSGYESPVAKALSGADISWIVGLAFTTILYFLWARRRPREPQMNIGGAFGSQISEPAIAADRSPA